MALYIHIGIDPNLVHLGSFVLSWHWVLSLLALVVAVYLVQRWAPSWEIPKNQIWKMAPWVIIGSIVVARVFTLIDTSYSQNPWSFFKLWQGGFATYGAILGGLLAGGLYAWRKGYGMRRFGDMAAPAIIAAQPIARIGCLIAGDAYGSPTTWPIGLVYTHPDALAPLGVGTHPAVIYEIIWDLAVLAALLMLRGRLRPDGALFVCYLAMYALGRFLVGIVRENVIVVAGLNAAQIIALALLAVTVPYLVYRVRFQSRAAQ
ncbi:prolipoprotein diacylglyceryl transferase [Chloroflexota bacterium]